VTGAAHWSRRHKHENTDASKMAARGWSVPSGTQQKTYQKLCEGEVLSLDRSLLMGDFSVVRFRSDFVLFSEKNHVKMHTNQCVWTMPYLPGRLSGAIRRGPTTAPEMQTPSQSPDRRRLLERWAYKHLRTKHFHGVSSAGPHTYSLKSRYGKVRIQGGHVTPSRQRMLHRQFLEKQNPPPHG
jgi:hypothetical protein